jgi:hypothetical protein
VEEIKAPLSICSSFFEQVECIEKGGDSDGFPAKPGTAYGRLFTLIRTTL